MSDKFTAADLGGRDFRPVDGQEWGGWVLKRSNLTLTHGEGNAAYEIDLERINCARDLWEWTAHISRKGWATPPVLHGLVNALDDIFRDLNWNVPITGKVADWLLPRIRETG